MIDSFDNPLQYNFRMTINKVWNLIKEGHSEELSQEEQKLGVIIMNHQESVLSKIT